MHEVLTVQRRDIAKIIPTIPSVLSNEKEGVAVIAKPGHEFFAITTASMQRSVCEFDENHLQIVPYVTLYDSQNQKFYITQHSQYHPEPEMRGRQAMGQDIHLEIIPTGRAKATLPVSIVASVLDFLQTNYTLTFSKDQITLLHASMLENALILYEDISAMGAEHLAVNVVIPVNSTKIQGPGRWMDLNEISSDLDNSDYDRWSAMVLYYMADSCITIDT